MSTSNPAAHEPDDYVRIFDTTLRDGEQSPGATMNLEEKVTIARQLERLNVDIIEAGFAASSPGDLESVRRVAETVTTPVVLSLARTIEGDVEQALRAVEKAAHPGIHIFIATSDIHLKYKLQMNREDVLNAATVAVAAAKKHLDHIEFSCEDASRSDWDYMVSVLTEVVRAGAKILNLPDTTGHAIPEEYGRMFAYLREHVPGSDRVTWSAHCHNDLGLAVANSLGAIKNGVAPGRVHDQRYRRARRQHFDGRSGDGAQDAQGPVRNPDPDQHPADLSRLAPAVAGNRPAGPRQ